MKFSVTDHLHFFDGYLDAVTRFYTTDSILIASAVRLITDTSTVEEQLDLEIIKEEILEKNGDF